MSLQSGFPWFLASLLILSFITPCAAACVFVSEFMPNPTDSCMDCTEWIEVYSDTVITNITLDAGGKNTTFSFNNTGFLIITENKTLFLASWGVDESSVIEGPMSLNNNGDCIVLYNVTLIEDQACYSNQHENVSWSLCNGTWTETGNATPGYENLCPEEAETPPVNDTEGNATDVFDYSGISLDVSGPAAPVRFGDFSQVKAVLHTGESKVPLRIVTYIYSPHWVSVDLEGGIIHYHLNETETALEIETPGGGEDVILHLPLFVKNNCDGEYENGLYTGNVRVYEDGNDGKVDEEKFNITLSGNNPLFCCEECPECDCPEKKCSCSSVSSYSAVNDEETELIELLSYNDTVSAGIPFETRVRIENTESGKHVFSVYSYAYEGSRCLSLGFDGSRWLKTWTANKHSIELTSGESDEMVLKNAFENETEPGIYTFRIRLKHDEKDFDITKSIKVLAAPVPEEDDDSEIEIVTEEEAIPPVTGMVTEIESEDAPAATNWYDSFISWLLSVFKL